MGQKGRSRSSSKTRHGDINSRNHHERRSKSPDDSRHSKFSKRRRSRSLEKDRRDRIVEKSREDSRRRKSRDRSHERKRKSSSHDEKTKNDRRHSRSLSQTKSSDKAKKSSKSRKRSKERKKKKKHRSRSSSTSSSSSSSSTNSIDLLVKLEEERKQQIAEMKRRKELIKTLETPEEKRLRRLAKKEKKERKRKERMGWDTEYLHYTNTDNPFGDNALHATFVWKKKLEKEGIQDASSEELERINRLKQQESKQELEKVKKRRQEREIERQKREEEQALLQRQREADQFKEWGMQEDQFHVEQAKLRSKIRIKDGRAKPIDLLAQYISAEEELNAIEMHEPYTYLNGLTVTDLEDLIEDIKVYKEIDSGRNLSYWNDITVIVEDELRKLRKLEQDEDYRVALERREGINPSVAEDVASVFKGKTAEQLTALQSHIQSKLDGSSSGVDISYWESLLSQLKAYIARARLRDRHQDNLKAKLALLKAEQGVDEEQEIPGGPSVKHNSPQPGPSAVPERLQDSADESQDSFKSRSSKVSEDGDSQTDYIVEETIMAYENGEYSPKMLKQDDIEPGIFVIGEEEDSARLELARSQVLGVGKKVENVWTAEEKALQHEAKKGMTNDEASFGVETPVDQIYLWSDKYRPRKPRYFNRVHTGFEWNKYNQTHYDMDNPPPKIVQGYKFNIFYPDLIDKNSTPEYHLTACADNPDFSILRFHAGPPYEDIAFKIVNREWEYSYKRGFRCQFHNNIFQLWFHFKRYRYRR